MNIMTTPPTSPPRLTQPIVLQPADLISNSTLTSQIVALTNAAFRRSKEPNPEKWRICPRFDTLETYHDMLVEHAVVAVIFDRNADTNDTPEESEESTESSGKVEKEGLKGKMVACAAAVPWRGGWKHEGAATESGWEIKAVAVDGSPAYLRKGLAVQIMSALERYLIEKAKGAVPKELEADGKGKMPFWILAAECINGAYWRKRGYKEVRRSTEGDLTWGCKTSFDLVVFRKDVEYDIGP
jgi:GNAT superfamily N-acetyltransferase